MNCYYTKSDSKILHWFILPRDGNIFIMAKNIIVTPDGMCLKKWFKLAELLEFRGENYVYMWDWGLQKKKIYMRQNVWGTQLRHKRGFENKMSHIFFSFFDSSLTVRKRRKKKKKIIKIITIIILEVISFKVFVLKLFIHTWVLKALCHYKFFR